MPPRGAAAAHGRRPRGRPARALLGAALALSLLAGAAAGAAGLWLRDWVDRPGPLAAEATVELPPGLGLRDIARRLGAAGVVAPAPALEAAARLGGRARGLKAGEYRFPAAATPRAVIDALEAGRVVQHAVTVPEGLTVREVLDLLAAHPALAGELPPAPPEGSLLPETYRVPRGEARGRLVERMRRAMEAELAAAWAARAPNLPLAGPAEALTLASLVERETAVPAERPLVAAVFVNRLRRGMRLQTDPTVVHALAGGRGALGRPLTRDDLEVDHPYNTYRIPGLPPGPIANPGRAALRAAVAPAAADHLYFVADGSGGHAFAASLAEHNRNVARWRRLARQRAGGGLGTEAGEPAPGDESAAP